MAFTLPDLINIHDLQILMEHFYIATGIPVGIVGCDDEILIATGWQEICTDFHRCHPGTAERCRQSDNYIKSHLAQLATREYISYKCRNGLWDIAKPIIIADEHLATLYLGQFFYDDEEVDEEFFRQQALEFGFESDRYMSALRRIPIFTREKVRQILEYYNSFVDFIACMGLANHRQAKTEARFRESEEQFAKAFNANPSILTITTMDEGRYIEINEAFVRILGFKREEVIGHTSSELNIWETPEARTGFIRILQEEGKVRDLEVSFRTKQGEIIVGLVSAEIIEINGGQFMLILLNDLTARKRAENALFVSEQLLISEKRFRSLFEHMIEGVVYGKMLYDDKGFPADFVYLDVNNAYSKLTGLHDVIGKKFSELLPDIKNSSPALLELYGRVAATGQPEKSEIQIKELSLWRSISVYSTEKGTFVAVSDNITDRKRIEEELVDSHHKLQELTAHLNLTREQEQKSFARKVHDELGTSLTLLKFDLAWIKRNHPSVDKMVEERLKAMDELIHECTQKIQGITSELRPSLLDEQGLAAAIEWQAKEFEKRSGIICQLKIDTSLQPDQDKSINMYRVFQQALSNVMRHACATRVKVSLLMIGQKLVLKIVDNGAGINEQEISADSSFGIRGMEERARLCGGALTIKGVPGKGTTIALSIPV